MIMGRSDDNTNALFEDSMLYKLTEDNAKFNLYKNLIQSASFDKIVSGVNSSTPEGEYVKSVDFDESTNTFTFVLSDNSVLVAKVTASGSVDLSKYALKSELDAEVARAKASEAEIKSSIPDVSKLASLDYVNNKVDNIQVPSYDDTEIRNMISSESGRIDVIEGNYASKEWVKSQGYSTESSSYDDTELRSLINAKVSVSDLEPYATREWVESQGYSTEASSYDDTELRELISTKADSSDLETKYASKDELNSKIAAVSNSLQWKDNVVTYDDIERLYPNPNKGDTVYVDDEGATYEFNGTEWVVVSTSSIPVANEETNGLMTSAMFRKLEGLSNYDDSSLQGRMITLIAKCSELEDKISTLSRSNVEVVDISSSITELKNPTKDYTLTGSMTASLNVTGKSAVLNEVEITDNSRLKVSVSGDVDFRLVTVSGEFPKSSGNTVISIGDATYVNFENMTFDSTQYNGVEIGLSGTKLAKYISFTNCKFSGSFSNNSILIFGTEDNAVVNISNCVFEDVSNVLRLSNRTNVNCTVNITNCTVNKWESMLAYTGFLLCQDYTSSTTDEADNLNLFGNGKITINFINLTMPNGKKLEAKDAATICGTQDANQIVYVYRNASSSVLSYDSSKYPVINVM